MSDNVVVAVRVRPLITREEADNPLIHWQVGTNNTITQVDPGSGKTLSTSYKFDRVFGNDYNTIDVYNEVAEPIVESALAGFNGTVFAYGQTSSGKTYTMMGDKNSPGIIPLAIRNIFQSIENTPDREYLLRASYMEIYNENISDLLGGRDSRVKSLAVREDLSGSVYVADLSEVCVNCEEKLLAVMKKGEKNRHIGVTNMNERSSRSHSIFRLIIESRVRCEDQEAEEAVTVSHLNLVDLAGSENASQSGATGERLKEGGFINRSLFMLGRVISQLSDGEPFVNYRDSKLTRILQLSLGGNAKTAIVCNVTPAAIEQTSSTLRFASRAKSIKNKPVVNEVLSDACLLKRYVKEIGDLKRFLEKERNTDKAQEVEQVREQLDEQARRNQELEAKINELKTKLVVSSHPITSSKVQDKKKKARRETWAAPAMRKSMGPLHLSSLKMDYEFLTPALPPWAEHKPWQGSSSSSIESESVMDCSISSDDFGKQDVSYNLDLAEQSKLENVETAFESPVLSNITVKRRKRVKFDITPSPPAFTREAECQTDDSLLPKRVYDVSLASPMRDTVSSAQGLPGTPAHVLRKRNNDLKQRLEENDVWLSDWQREQRELSEYHKKEIQALQESFDAKLTNQKPLAEMGLDEELEEKEGRDTKHAHENTQVQDFLRRSLHDSEILLKDANCALSQRNQEVHTLMEELEVVREENMQRASVESEYSVLLEEHNALKKTLIQNETKLKELENERQDFDMMKEFALEKQKRKEEDLRRSLDDAWQEIAAYEKSDKELVRQRFQRTSELEKEVSRLRTDAEAHKSGDIMAKLEEQLQNAEEERKTTLQESQELKKKLDEMMTMTESVREADLKVAELEKELSEARAKIEILEDNVAEKIQTLENLHEQLDKKTVDEDKLSALQEEVQTLQCKLEECSRAEGVSSKVRRSSAILSSSTHWDISCKLSETLQVLEESVLTPSSADSVSFLDDPLMQPQDLAVIKEQLMALQEALQAQDNHQQKFDNILDEAVKKEYYHQLVVSEYEEEVNIWNMYGCFTGDYIVHSRSQQEQPRQRPFYNPRLSRFSIARQSNAFLNLEEMSEEIRERIKSEYEAKYKEEREALEARLRQDTFVEGDTLYEPRLSTVAHSLDPRLSIITPHTHQRLSTIPTFPAPHLAGLSSTMLNETFETSILNLDSAPTQELEELRQKVQYLTNENVALLNQVKQIRNEDVMDKQMHKNSEDIEINTSRVKFCIDDSFVDSENTDRIDSVLRKQYLTPMSLADELRDTSMSLTPCHEPDLKSVDISQQSENDIDSLKQHLDYLSEENRMLQSQVHELRSCLEKANKNTKWHEKQSARIEAEEDKLDITQSEENIETEEEIPSIFVDKTPNREVDYPILTQTEDVKKEEAEVETEIYYKDEKLSEELTVIKSEALDIQTEDVKKKEAEVENEINYQDKILSEELTVVKSEAVDIQTEDEKKEEFEVEPESNCQDKKVSEELTKSEALVIQTEDEVFEDAEEYMIVSSSDLQAKIVKLEEDLRQAITEREIMELKIKELNEELSCKNITEEEVCALRWKVDSLTEEKTELEEELKLVQEEFDQFMAKEEEKIEVDKHTELKAEEENEEAVKGKVLELLKEEGKLKTLEVELAEEEKVVQAEEENTALEGNVLELLKGEGELKPAEIELAKEEKVGVFKHTEFSENEEGTDIKCNEIELLKGEVDDLKEKLKVKTEEVEDAVRSLAKLKSEKEKLELIDEQFNIAKDAVYTLKSELDIKTEESDSNGERYISEITQTLKSLKDMMNEKMAELKTANNKIELLESDMKSKPTLKEDGSEQLKQDLDNALEKLDILEREKVEQQLGFRDQLANMVAEKDSELEQIITNFTEKEEDFETKMKEHEQTIKESEELRKSLVNKDLEIQHLTKELSNLRTMVQDVESRLTIKSEEHLALEASVSRLQSDFSQLELKYENKIQETEKTVERYEEKLSIQVREHLELSNILEEQKTLLCNAETEIKSLKESQTKKHTEIPAPISISQTSTDLIQQNLIEEKLDEYEKLKNEHSVKINECSQMKDVIANLKTLLAKRENEIKKQALDYKEEISSNLESLTRRDEELENMTSILAEKNIELSNVKLAIEAKDHKLERLVKELEEAKKSLITKEDEVQKSLSGIETRMTSRIEELQQELDHQSKNYDEVCEDRRNMVDSMKKLEKEKGDLVLKCNTLNAKLDNLEEDCIYIRSELEGKEAEIANKDELLSSHIKQLEILEEEVTTLSSKEIELIDEQVASNQKIDKMNGVIEKYKLEMSEKDEQLQNLISDLGSSQSKYTELEEQAKSFEEANMHLTEKLAYVEEENKRAVLTSIELEKVSEKLAAAEQNLVIQKNEHEKKTQNLSAQNTELGNKIQYLSTQNTEHSIKIQDLLTRRTEHERKIVELQDEISSLSLQKDELNNKLSETENLYRDSKVELEDIKLAYEKLEYEFSQADEILRNAEVEFNEKLSSIEMEKVDLMDELNRIKSNESYLEKQRDSNQAEIETLLTHVEKYETEMTEKEKEYESEMAIKDKRIDDLNIELERKVARVSEIEEELKQKNKMLEDLEIRCANLQREITEHCNKVPVPETENKYVDLQSKYNKKVKESEEKDKTLVSDVEQLSRKLLQYEKELGFIKEKLLKSEDKCSQMDNEMDDIVKHYKNEVKQKDEEQECISRRLTIVEKELTTARTKLKASLGGNLAGNLAQSPETKPLRDEIQALQIKLYEKDDECKAVNTRMTEIMRKYTQEINEKSQLLESVKEQLSQIQKELSSKIDLTRELQELLDAKTKECKTLDAEMDDIVQYYKREMKASSRQFDDISEQLQKTQKELSETRTKMWESSLHSTESSRVGVEERERKVLENNMILKSRIDALENENTQLREKIGELSHSVGTLEERIRVGKISVTSLMETIGDHEKTEAAYKKEKGELEKQIREQESTITTLRKLSDSQQSTKIEGLLQKIQKLEGKLRDSNLAENDSNWKTEYGNLFEECENYKSIKEELEEKVRSLTTQLNTIMNNPQTPGLLTGKKKSRLSVLEKERDNLRYEYAELMVKLKDTEATLETLRKNQGVISNKEELQRELTWMKKKMEEAERERDLTNKNYDSLERDHQALQKELENLSHTKESYITPAAQPPPTSRPYQAIETPITPVSQQEHSTNSGAWNKESHLGDSVCSEDPMNDDIKSLREKVTKLTREKQELNFRLLAQNAPAEKRAQLLDEELRKANAKVTNLGKELRRLQKSRDMDSTIYEINTKVSHNEVKEKDYDYNSGSGVVLEVQVLELKNKVYHLEKNCKRLEYDSESLRFDAEHYKKKAEEWKMECLKERNAERKLKKELEGLQTQLRTYQEKVDELMGTVERQRFELGDQRETIKKLEGEKQQLRSTQVSAPIATPVLPPSPKKISEEATSAEGNTKSSRVNLQFGAHNAPPPPQIKMERIPGVKPATEGDKTSEEKLPLWKRFDKENKDYSKYYHPAQPKKISQEDCKTQ